MRTAQRRKHRAVESACRRGTQRGARAGENPPAEVPLPAVRTGGGEEPLRRIGLVDPACFAPSSRADKRKRFADGRRRLDQLHCLSPSALNSDSVAAPRRRQKWSRAKGRTVERQAARQRAIATARWCAAQFIARTAFSVVSCEWWPCRLVLVAGAAVGSSLASPRRRLSRLSCFASSVGRLALRLTPTPRRLLARARRRDRRMHAHARRERPAKVQWVVEGTRRTAAQRVRRLDDDDTELHNRVSIVFV